jgi:hypothetical protein
MTVLTGSGFGHVGKSSGLYIDINIETLVSHSPKSACPRYTVKLWLKAYREKEKQLY